MWIPLKIEGVCNWPDEESRHYRDGTLFSIPIMPAHIVEISTILKDLATVVIGIIGLRALIKWKEELKGKTRHHASRELIMATANLVSLIAVARGSWRTIFFHKMGNDSKSPIEAERCSKIALRELNFWESHLIKIEDAGVAFRNASTLPRTIWHTSCPALVENMNVLVDQWSDAVQDRIDELMTYQQTRHPDYLQAINPILVCEQDFKHGHFEHPEIKDFELQSSRYWDKLSQAKTEIIDKLRPSFMA